MNIHERDETKQEDLNILLEKIYLYLRYGEIEKAFDALDAAIDENKNHYEYLVEKIKLLYMLYLKEEAYEVLDANIEMLYSNIDKIDVDFISRRIYYHFYRDTELNTNSTSNNFDYLKITKEFINKYGFSEQEKQETSLTEKTADPISETAENVDIMVCFSEDEDYNLFGETVIPEDDSVEVMSTPDENSEYLSPEINEANIFEEVFIEEVIELEEPEQEMFADNALEPEEPEQEIFIDNTLEPKEPEQEIFIDNTIEFEEDEQEFVAEIGAEETKLQDETNNETETTVEQEQEDEDFEIISAEEVITEQTNTEEEDIVIEDNPHIDIPIYLGKVNGKDVFFESMAEHIAPPKEEKSIIIIDSSQYTFTRLASLLVLGFVIGAAIVYYL